jgi:glycosyltransferase involved in cell wall biosynthesis
VAGCRGGVKIGYLFSRYPVPSQTFCDTEMRALEERGFEIEIYSCSPPATSFRHDAGGRPRGPVFHAPPRRGLELGRLAALERGVWPAALIAGHEARFGARYEPSRRAVHAVAFAETMQRRGIDHVHVHFANRATHAALFIHALTGIPFSFTAHAQDFLVDLGSDALLQEMCAQAAFVVAVSDFSRQALLEKCPAAGAKIHRIYNGLPLDRWPVPAAAADPATEVANRSHEPWRALGAQTPAVAAVYDRRTPGPTHGATGGHTPPLQPEANRAGCSWTEAPGALRIFSAGRLIEFKGFDDLIAACALLRDRAVAFECDIAGDGPAHDALESRIAELGLARQVRLLGLLPQAEIRTRLAASGVFALASRVDAKGSSDVLPTVILEAMAAGRAVVSTRLAGIPELVIDGVTGILVAPGDPNALAGALASLADDAGRRDRFGRAGRSRLEEHFSAGQSSGQLAALFSTGQREKPCVPSPESTLVLLLDAWPGDTTPPLARLLEAVPGARILALTVGAPASQAPPGGEVLSLVPSVEFLPDAIVLEAEWRERASEAHRLEVWRGGVGAGVETIDFLLAARRALYLHHHWTQEPPVRHIHAAGAAALLCTWLLLQLDPTRQASFLLPGPPNGLSNSAVRRLAPAFQGGWLPGSNRLAAELGDSFSSDDPRTQAEGGNSWQNALCRWAGAPLFE